MYLLTVYHFSLIAGFTPRELAMQCDFYECADLIDELARVQLQQEVARIKESRIKGTEPFDMVDSNTHYAFDGVLALFSKMSVFW